MTPIQLTSYLNFAIKNTFPVLITGRPGIGKSDIVSSACSLAEADLIISHPVVSDPTDYKGLPFMDAPTVTPDPLNPGFDKIEHTAHFAPFGELKRLINAKKPTVFFLDDLGQAPASVQAAAMQLILARQINGHKVSPFITFIAATNRREDKAGVTGILEPVKSRFCSIVPLDVNTDDWVKWAIDNNMPTELIAFIRFRPAILEEFKPTKDMTNSVSPRTVAQAGKQQAAGLPHDLEFEVFSGAAGEGFASEYMAFLKIFRNLPDVNGIILNPTHAQVPTQADILYALSGALAHRANSQNIGAIIKFLNRTPGEIQVATMKDAITRHNTEITSTKAFIEWAAKNHGFII